MTPEDAFLEAILATPDDDTPRLVFADWLDEHGNPERADFIRVQCQLARLPEDDPSRAALEVREQALKRALKRCPRPALCSTLPEGVWVIRGRRRGFPEEAVFSAPSTFLAHAEWLFRRAPIRHAVIGPKNHERIAALTASPLLCRLTSLHLSVWEDDDWRALAECPQLATLTSLGLERFSSGGEGPRLLGASPHLRAVAALSITGEMRPPDGLLALGPLLARARRLRLRFCDNGSELLRQLAGSPLVSNLRDLALNSADPDDEGLRAFAASPQLANLHSLHLGAGTVTIRGVEALAASPHLAGLTALSLNHLGYFNRPSTRIGDAGAQALAASSSLVGLRFLDLYANGIREGGARALAGSRHLTGLAVLNLNANQVGDEGARALASSPLADLVTLNISNNKITDAGAATLAQSPGLPRLARLYLGGNPLGPDTVRALALSPHRGALHRLHFSPGIVSASEKRSLCVRLGPHGLRC
jgi:uncharacterized protein (TIGR02996 family)